VAQLITLVVPSDEQHLLVVVTRGVRTWRADIPDLDTAWQMRSLAEIHRSVRSLLGPEWVNYEFRTGDRRLDPLIAECRVARRAADLAEERARDLTGKILAVVPQQRELSVRELGVMLAVSYQRIQQLRRENAQ